MSITKFKLQNQKAKCSPNMFSYTYKTWCFSEMKIKPNLEIEICKNLLSSIDALLEIPQGSFVAFVGSQVVVQP